MDRDRRNKQLYWGQDYNKTLSFIRDCLYGRFKPGDPTAKCVPNFTARGGLPRGEIRDCAMRAASELLDTLRNPAFFYTTMISVEHEFLVYWKEGCNVRSAQECPIGFRPLVRLGDKSRDGTICHAHMNHGQVTDILACPKAVSYTHLTLPTKRIV